MIQRNRTLSTIIILLVTVFLAQNIRELILTIREQYVVNSLLIVVYISLGLNILFDICLILQEFLVLAKKLSLKGLAFFMLGYLFFAVLTILTNIALIIIYLIRASSFSDFIKLSGGPIFSILFMLLITYFIYKSYKALFIIIFRNFKFTRFKDDKDNNDDNDDTNDNLYN